jgi:hypothetical protein
VKIGANQTAAPVPPKPRHPTTLCTPPYDIAQGGMVLHGSSTLFPLGVALLIIGLMLEADATSAMTAIKPTRANRWLRASTATKIDDEAKWHPQLRRHRTPITRGCSPHPFGQQLQTEYLFWCGFSRAAVAIAPRSGLRSDIQRHECAMHPDRCCCS